MKLITTFCVVLALSACRNHSTPEVKMADSANKISRETALESKAIVIDESSSTFLVRAFEENSRLVRVANVAQQSTLIPEIKAFADSIYQFHLSLQDSMQSMAALKNITLPSVMAHEDETQINIMLKKKGEAFNKAFINFVRKEYTSTITSYREATTDTHDFDVRAFADRALTQFSGYIKKANEIYDKYW